jgi:hypothetical protein
MKLVQKTNKSIPAKECKAHKHFEYQCKQTCNMKCIQHKSGKGSVKKLYYTGNNVRTDCLMNITMESACISENTGQVSQTSDTPPTDETLMEDIGCVADKNAKQHILDGTYAPPTDTNQDTTCTIS